MKRVSLMVALAMLGLLAAAPAVQAAPSTAFTGEWIATDSGDGSTEHLVVGPGAHPQVLFIDQRATGGVCEEQASDYFTSLVRGSVDENELNGTFILAKCGSATVITRDVRGDFPLSWTLQTDGTLIDTFGDVWERV